MNGVIDVAVMYFLPVTLALITFSMGLSLTTPDFKALAEHPKVAFVGLFGQLLALPLLAFVIAGLFRLPPAFAIGLVLVASCPGGIHSNLFTSLAKGDVALSVALTTISGLFCLFTLPFYVYLSTQLFSGSAEIVSLSVSETILQLLVIVIAPLLIGMAIRARYIRIARPLEKVSKTLAVIMLIGIVVGSLASGWGNIVDHTWEVGIAVMALNISAMLVGAGLARLYDLPGKQIITITMEVGVQNTTLAFGISMALLNNFLIGVPAIIYAILVYASASCVIGIGRYSQRNSKNLFRTATAY
ncbi:Pantothenate precursors transporter PanS [BD1-7 clade bacterium]|uniref:Pantothenates transporter PanS n=1 Tax=BD1-7 clade bacterium TaxID=2029982 RepID=A0A5S9QR86_9GAMM|nr:Pantothenate precursors transporter PanS [BD1-7 clade bacterium]CAA0121860.1 Pantothenate precursors transporter PanS [BD1-7 clade bacterium]